MDEEIKAIEEEAARLFTISNNLKEHPLASKEIGEVSSRLLTISNKLRQSPSATNVLPVYPALTPTGYVYIDDGNPYLKA